MRKIKGKISLDKEQRRYRRRLSIRKKINGTADCPRVCVQRSNKHITVQVIDDVAGHTLVSVQTYGKNKVDASSNVEGAKLVGARLAEEMKKKNLEAGVFDRAGYKFHGVVASLVESARENGIKL
jgi:large subunit ribosomal protein L18